MCGRFYAGERFRDQLEKLLLELGVPSAEPLYEAGGQDVVPSNASIVICGKGGEAARARPSGAGGDAGVSGQSGAGGSGEARPGGAEHGGAEPAALQTVRMGWGFENPYRKGLVINARGESAGEKTLFKESLAKRRCIIPATGFYEWDSWKARFRFTEPDGSLVLLAGLWRPEADGPRYTILTTEANRSMTPVHDRMPVRVGYSEVLPWILDGGRTAEFLGRPQAELLCEQDEGQIRMEGLF